MKSESLADHAVVVTMGDMVDVEKIKKLRLKLGMTQAEAGVAAGFKGRQAWNNIESGRQPPSLSSLEKIAKALGVKPGSLLK